MENTYKAAAIGRTGAGNFGHGLHLPYKRLPNVEMVAVADESDEGRENARVDSEAHRGYTDYREMLEKENLDIVSVCPRWLDQRFEMVMACIDAGYHVYCEKPFAISLEDADQMVEAADEAGVKIAVGHFHGTYMPGVARLKREIEKGRIGRLMSMHAHGKHDHRGGGEDAMDLGTHKFNLMRFLAGDIDWMFARVTVDGRDIQPGDVHEATEPLGPVVGDWIDAYFAFTNGVAGFFDSRRDQPGRNDRYGLEIVGEEGTISLRGGTVDTLMIYPYPLWEPCKSEQAWEPLELAGHTGKTIAGGHVLAIEDLIGAIEEDRDPICSGRDGAKTIEMVMGCYESQITGARVYLPMKNRTHPLEQFKASHG